MNEQINKLLEAYAELSKQVRDTLTLMTAKILAMEKRIDMLENYCNNQPYQDEKGYPHK